MSKPLKRRKRPAVACVLCRKRKIRCNREFPCNNCVRSRTGDCVYENRPHELHDQSHNVLRLHQPITPNTHASQGATTSTPISHHVSPASAHSPLSTDASQEAEANRLRLRIRELEDQLSKINIRSNCSNAYTSISSSLETTASRLGGIFHVQCETPNGSTGPAIARSLVHKTRMFGQSHWCVTGVLLIRDIFETIDLQLEERCVDAWAGISKCKVLARYIKARRTPPWPVSPKSPLPDKAVADVLVEHYLKNTESVRRILHIPTFREQYNALWAPETVHNQAFIIQTKLVLALGAITYDELFSLRPSAIQWVHEAHSWLSEPKFKSRLDIQTLQSSILLLIAQEMLGVVGDSMWIAAGALVRRAMFMGLHRDPARLPDRSVMTCELRRRLWNTIIELNLQASLGSGGPVFMSMSDFDTEPPGNFDDDQLLEADPVPRPAGECTQMTMALVLRETFSQRLDVMRFLNDVSSGGSYDETLRLDAELRAKYKILGRQLQSCTGQGAKRSLSSTDLRTLDTIMYRYLSAIHVPYFVAAQHETKYAYSRTVVVDCALKVWNSLGTMTPVQPPQSPDSRSMFDGVDYLARQVTCGSGFYMIAAMHSALLIIMELRAQLKESDGLGPKILRPDLLAVLSRSQEWSLEVIKAGHTNVKGYLLLRIIAAQIDGMSRNLPHEALVANLLRAANEVSETCTAILTEMAGRLTGTENGVALPISATMPTPPYSGDWAFSGLDDLLASAGTKNEGWPENYWYGMDELEWTLFDG